jgi:hypothetical protein
MKGLKVRLDHNDGTIGDLMTSYARSERDKQ